MVQQSVDDALERQAQCSRTRKNPCADDNHDDALQCPITHEVCNRGDWPLVSMRRCRVSIDVEHCCCQIMRDPVMAADGHTYERTAIEE